MQAAAGALRSVAGGEDGDAEGAAAGLAAAEGLLAPVAGVDPRLDALAERLGAAAVELSDVASELRSYADGVDSEPGRLERLEERLAAIERLERKHGGTIEAVLEHAARCRAEIDRLESAGELAGEIERRLDEAKGRRAELGAKLTAGRRRAAPRLETAVAEELAGLAMEGAKLEATLEPHGDGFGPNGAETVELRVATNPGMPMSPLRDAASGGELSRIMLALSGVAGGAGGATRVFDEIDAGVGGATARVVGDRLRALAAGGQVLCITHLPQVASQAGRHFRISKRLEGGATIAVVEPVEGEDLVAEIVRMLGGGRDDAAATEHARELLAA